MADGEQGRSPLASAAEWMKRRWYVVAAVLVAFVWYSVALSEGEGDKGGPGSAQLACENLVEDQLRSPGSADFTGVSATEGDAGEWAVTGSVDAENAFGGSVRTDFYCQLQHISGEDYSGDAVLN